MERIDAINHALGALGQAPVNDPASNHPDVQVINQVLDAVNKEIQSPGLWFNRDRGLNLVQNVDGEVVVPSIALSCDPVDTCKQYVQRGDRLYDTLNSTFNIGESVKVNMVTELPIENLPYSAFDLLQKITARRVQFTQVGDQNKDDDLRELVIQARLVLGAEDVKNSDYNALRTPYGRRVLTGIRPVMRRM